MKLRKHEIIVPIFFEDGKKEEKVIEVRFDPLTGENSKITPKRRVIGLASGKNQNVDFPDAGSEHCPFCKPNIFKVTPILDKKIFGEKRIINNRSIIFPNLFPYGRWSAVLVFTEVHRKNPSDFLVEEYFDALVAAKIYLSRLKKVYSAKQQFYFTITQNHLYSSGATVFHPHLQIHADLIPGNYIEKTYKSLDEYFLKNRRDFFKDLIDYEIREGKRFFPELSNSDFFVITPFAPRGIFEFIGIFPEVTSFLDLDDEKIRGIAEFFKKVLNFYGKLGRFAFNIAIYSYENQKSEGAKKPILIRVVSRARFKQFYRNDISFHEKMFESTALMFPPEEIRPLVVESLKHQEEK